MSTANSPVSDPNAEDTGGFFSSFTRVLNQAAGLTRGVADTANAVVPLWNRQNPAPPSNNNAPTFAGTSNTTGTVTGTQTNYLPWILGGAAVLVAVVLFVKK